MSTNVSDALAPLAYSFDEAAKVAGRGNSRSKLYEAARAGLLKVKKSGRSSVILHEDLVTYLRSLPDADLAEIGEDEPREAA